MAYHTKGEAKFEELAVMFAPFVDNAVLVSADGDDDEGQNGVHEKRFVLVDEDDGDIEEATAMEADTVHLDLIGNH